VRDTRGPAGSTSQKLDYCRPCSSACVYLNCKLPKAVYLEKKKKQVACLVSSERRAERDDAGDDDGFGVPAENNTILMQGNGQIVIG
jgi:hypothetical protein